MESEGPPLELLTHRLSECPAEFLAEPRSRDKGVIDVAAIVWDHLRAMGMDARDFVDVSRLRHTGDQACANRLRLISVTTWLLHEAWFLQRPKLGPRMSWLLAEGLDGLARVIKADTAVTDPDRRAEVARLCLKYLDLLPQGETAAQAIDRMTSLDSTERARVVKETRGAEARAREVREMMARRAAEEAAAKVSRE